MYGRNAQREGKKVYFGAYEAKGRSMTEQIAESNLLNHRIEVEGGVMQEECSRTLSTFFRKCVKD